MLDQAGLRRRIRVWQILRAEVSRATGPWSRRPYPGQRYRHGWRPTALGRLEQAMRALPDKDLIERWHDPELDSPDSTKYSDGEVAAIVREVGRRAGTGEQFARWQATEKRVLRNKARREAAQIQRQQAIEDRYNQLISEGYSPEHAFEEAAGTSLAKESAWDIVGRRAGESYERALRRGYAEHIDRLLAEAESVVIGYWLSPEGKRAVARAEARAKQRGRTYRFTPADLWRVPQAQAERWASDEAREFWESIGGRQNFAEWRATIER